MTDIAPRQTCARIVSHWLTTGDFPDRLIPDLTPQRALVQEMIYGTVRMQRTLAWILDGLVSREPDPQAKGYLLIGLYQLFMMDNIPPHAALNETVEAAKADLDPARVRFINGVLRNSLRRQEEIRKHLKQAEIGIQLSHPAILIDRWAARYGKAATKALCEWNNRRPEITIRINSVDTPEAEALRQQLTPHPAAPDRFFMVPQGTPITGLPGFEAGLFSVQDPATRLAVSLLELTPGLKLLDACAAPGGKAFACADQIRNEGIIIAADLHEDRLKRLKQNVERMNLPCIRVLQADAREKPAAEALRREGPFDRLLLDVPCSNTGVLARRPDARWRFSASRLDSLVYTQWQMLDAASLLLKQEGILVYSTCSLEPEENMQQVTSWVEHHPAFLIGKHLESIPPDSGTDGAFAVQLIKTADRS